MPNCLLKKVLPFTLMFLVGVGLAALPGLFSAREGMKARTAFWHAGRGDSPYRGRKRHCNLSRHYYDAAREPHSRTQVVATESFPLDRKMNDRGWIPAVVLFSPRPEYTREACDARIAGVVRLAVTFGANGEVSDVEVVSPLPFRLTEEAIKAAKAIRFTPARLNGRAVSTHGVVDCIFEIGECRTQD